MPISLEPPGHPVLRNYNPYACGMFIYSVATWPKGYTSIATKLHDCNKQQLCVLIMYCISANWLMASN